MNASLSHSRRGLATAARALAAVALVAWALAAAAPGVARADDAQVTVVSLGGAQQTLSLDALQGEEDLSGRAYVLRAAGGESSRTVSGFSLAALLEAAGADPFGFSYLEVQRPAGGAVLLTRHQALEDAAFPDGPPAVYATVTGTGFLRPSAGPDDLNAADSFEAPQGLTLVLRKGPMLRVRAKASTVRTRPGRPVRFAAVVERAGAGERLSYSWYFDDGHEASGETARHSFAKRGSYDVVLGVTSPGNEAGASAVVTVQVGAPIAGPDRKGGGRNRDAEAPDHGAASGAGGKVPGGGAGATAAGGAGPAASSRPAARSAPSHEPADGATRRTRARPTAPAGELVRGELIASAAAPEPPRAKAPTAGARTGHLDESEGAGVPDAALGLLVVAGLLGLGALAEIRSPHVSLGGATGERRA